MTVFLPKSAAAAIEGCGKDAARYATDCVKLTARDDGGFRIEGTDGRKAIIVQEGYYDPKPRDLAREDLAYEVAHPSDAKEVLIPAADLSQAFKLTPKGERLCVRIENDRAILVAGDTVKTSMAPAARYPNIDAVLPTRQPKLMFNIAPSVMMGVLKAAQTAAPDQPLTICIYPDEFNDGTTEGPLGCTIQTAEGILFDALLMPVTGVRDKLKKERDAAAEKAESAAIFEEKGSVPCGRVCPKDGCRGTVMATGSGDKRHGACTHCKFQNPEPADVEDQDEDDETAAAPFDPANALLLVADTPEKLRKCDLDRLLEQFRDYERAEEMACWVVERRPDLVDAVVESFGGIWILEPDAEAAMREFAAHAGAEE